MKRMFSIGLALYLFGSMANAQHLAIGQSMDESKTIDSVSKVRVATMYEKKLFINGTDTMPYRLLLPELYDSTKQYPLLLFLHGAGERGNDNEKQLIHGGSLFVKDENLRKFHAIVVFPQCPTDSYWSNVKITTDAKTGKKNFDFQPDGEPTKAMQMAMMLENKMLNDYPVNKDKVYVMGLSMGGMGTFEIVRRMPGVFAGAIPICGGADTSTARQIRKTAFWIIHGGRDDVISPKFSENMAMAIQQFYSAAEMQYTVYPDANHNSWDPAFKEPGLLSWLYKQHKVR